MTILFSTGYANKMLDEGANSGTAASVFDSGSIKVYTGSAPATADAAVTGTLLATFTLAADAVAAAATKSLVINGTPLSTTTGNAGTAGYFRIVGSADDGTSSTTQSRVQGTCGQGSGDCNWDNNVFTSGQTVRISSGSFGIT